MGNAKSTEHCEERLQEDLWWNPTSNKNTKENSEPNISNENNLVSNDENLDRVQRRKLLNKELNEFRKDLHLKHEQKRQLIVQKKQELIDLREQLRLQKMINEDLQQKLNSKTDQNKGETSCSSDLEKLLKENEEQKKLIGEMKERMKKYEEISEMNKELRKNIVELHEELQNVNVEVLNFQIERNEYKTHVNALKEVIKVSKEMLGIRENQIQELKQKMTVIETALGDREMELQAESLRKEYERQLKNIRNLRALYEERERMDRREKQNMLAIIEETKKLLQSEQNKNEENQVRIEELEKENSSKYDAVKSLESQLGLTKAECKELQAEMAIINQLFSHILMGFNNSQDIDLNKLIKILEENHDLLSKIAINEESTEISTALPKTLLDLVNQIDDEEQQKNLHDDNKRLETIVEETESPAQCVQLTSAEEIAQNLPKVWKILIELLSHQCVPFNTIDEASNEGNDPFCYKSVQTPKGPKLVLSISKTFIRLKDLILEKKSLEKETNHLKHLNTHLETRLQDQEKRLETVSKELTKTWHIVGKMQKQHEQLHTQEKILRYELAQKRKLLNELKEELEYCREKWIQAREKNTTTELQWKQLRKEFASRKPQTDASTESGYSDDKSSSDEEPNYENKTQSKQENDIFENEVSKSHETISNTPILDEVKSAVGNIEESTLESNVNVDISSTNNDVNHSNDTTDKTDTVQSNERQINNDGDKLQSTSTANQTKFNLEEMLARREERLKRMEEQGKELVTKVTNTTKKSVDICNKLENLHGTYGEDSSSAENSQNVPSSSSTSNKDVTRE